LVFKYSEITFTRYAQRQNIGKPNNLKVVGSELETQRAKSR
jgi:hypothetical protein